MDGVKKIDIWNSASRENIKNVLGYAVKNRRGYYDQLRGVSTRGSGVLDSFEMAGFIKTGHTLKKRTYSITDLGDQYYSDVFGKMNYWQKRVSGTLRDYAKKIFKF